MKKITKKAVILLLLGTTLLCANESIDMQIQKIQQASPQERVELMNTFKKQLREMNQEERSEAIASLRSSQNNNTVQSNSNEMARDTQMMQQNQREQMNQRDSMQQWNAAGQPGMQQPGTQTGTSAGTQTPFSPAR